MRKSTLGRHQASPERPFCPPGKRSPGQGSGAAMRCPTRRPAGLRRGITCQRTRLEGPSQLLQHPAAPRARGASTSRCCRRRPNPYLRSAPNKAEAGRDVTGGSADDRSVLGWAYRAVRSVPATHSVSQRPRKPVALSGSTRAAPLAPLSALPHTPAEAREARCQRGAAVARVKARPRRPPRARRWRPPCDR